jgi:hypothetical protein
MFQYMVKQPTAAYGGDTLEQLDRTFLASGTNMRKLFVEIGVVAALDAPMIQSQASR